MKKQTLYALIILFVTTYHNIHAVTINGKNLHEESYVQEFDCSKTNSVSLRIASNNINIQSTTLENINNTFLLYDHLFQNALDMKTYMYPETIMRSPNYTSLDFDNEVFFAEAGVEFNTPNIKTNQTIFAISSNDPKVDIKCRSLLATKTFIDASLLCLTSRSKRSPIQSIIFTLDQSHELPHLIEGDINFNNPEKNQHITVTGVKNIECIFSSEK